MCPLACRFLSAVSALIHSIKQSDDVSKQSSDHNRYSTSHMVLVR